MYIERQIQNTEDVIKKVGTQYAPVIHLSQEIMSSDVNTVNYIKLKTKTKPSMAKTNTALSSSSWT